MFNLRSAIDRLESRGVQVLLGGATSSTLAAIERAGFDRGPAGPRMHASVAVAIEVARGRSDGLT